VTGFAEGASELRIVVLPGNVMLLNPNLTPTEQTPVLFLSPGTPTRRFDWIFVHHDDDSGTA
jgi:hypothetical protein